MESSWSALDLPSTEFRRLNELDECSFRNAWRQLRQNSWWWKDLWLLAWEERKRPQNDPMDEKAVKTKGLVVVWRYGTASSAKLSPLFKKTVDATEHWCRWTRYSVYNRKSSTLNLKFKFAIIIQTGFKLPSKKYKYSFFEFTL